MTTQQTPQIPQELTPQEVYALRQPLYNLLNKK